MLASLLTDKQVNRWVWFTWHGFLERGCGYCVYVCVSKGVGFTGYFVCHVLGSGKSYTMMGSLSGETTKGIIPRLCDTLFDKIAQVGGDKPLGVGVAGHTY